MAAGEGSRLRPLTERWPKPVLPIDGRPVIATLLRELAAAGMRARRRRHGPPRRAGRGARRRRLGVRRSRSRFARQPGVLGSADAVRRALAAGAEPPLLVDGAPTPSSRRATSRGSPTRRASGAAGALAVRARAAARPAAPRGARRRRPGRGVLDDDPAASSSARAALGARAGARALLDGLPGPPYELADAVPAGDRGRPRDRRHRDRDDPDLTHPVDLVKENFPYLAGS